MEPANEVGAPTQGAPAAPAAAAGSEAQTPAATTEPAAAPAAEASAEPAASAKAPKPKTKPEAKPEATADTTSAAASAEPRRLRGRGGRASCVTRGESGRVAEASPPAAAEPQPDGPSVALPVDGGPTDNEAGVLGAPQVDEPEVTPRLEIPAEELDLVVPERVGDVVAPAEVKFGKKAMSSR